MQVVRQAGAVVRYMRQQSLLEGRHPVAAAAAALMCTLEANCVPGVSLPKVPSLSRQAIRTLLRVKLRRLKMTSNSGHLGATVDT